MEAVLCFLQSITLGGKAKIDTNSNPLADFMIKLCVAAKLQRQILHELSRSSSSQARLCERLYAIFPGRDFATQDAIRQPCCTSQNLMLPDVQTTCQHSCTQRHTQHLTLVDYNAWESWWMTIRRPIYARYTKEKSNRRLQRCRLPATKTAPKRPLLPEQLNRLGDEAVWPRFGAPTPSALCNHA